MNKENEKAAPSASKKVTLGPLLTPGARDKERSEETSPQDNQLLRLKRQRLLG
jgi:hypothetical protein